VSQLYSVSSDQSPDSDPLFSVSWLLDHAVVFCQSSSCVCHQCISGITGSFVCAILSSISVPACWTHSHCTPPAPIATLSTVLLYHCLSLSGLLLQGHTESVFFHPFCSIVLSMVPDLCIDYLNIPNFWGKFLSYVFYGIGKWIFWVLINTVQSIAVCEGSKEMLLRCHSAKMP